MNAGYSSPVKSRYWDIEIFDVTKLLRTGSNEITFLRGRDLNHDVTISSTGEKPEGEDYLHPVFAMLTVERPREATVNPASRANIDLAIGKLEINNAFNGETATITASLQNLGGQPLSPVTVVFTIDGNPVATEPVTIDASGVQRVSARWSATDGPHTIGAEVQVASDTVSSNNVMTKKITVGSLPDLVVSLDAPHRPGTVQPSQKSPLPVAIAVSAALLSFAVYRSLRRQPPHGKNGNSRMIPILCIIMLVTAGLPVLIPSTSAADTTSLYLLPVTVKNTGGSDATAFSVTIYLDGEKIATKTFDDGLGAGKEIKSDIPVHTSPGSHTVRVSVDEAVRIKDGDRSNNVAESGYVFP